MALTPEAVKKDLTAEQFRLYKLIWSRFLASQMAAAVYDSVSLDVESAGYIFKASRSEVKFPGFLAVYEEGKDEESSEIQTPLPNLQEGEPLTCAETRPEQPSPSLAEDLYDLAPQPDAQVTGGGEGAGQA